MSAENPPENICNESDLILNYLGALSPVDGTPPSESLVRERIMTLLSEDIEAGRLSGLIRSMIILTGADRFLPPQYAKFQKVVTEGAIYFISRLPRERICEKITDQLLLPQEASPGERICLLVKDMPTLHKLSQIIGRSPGIDAEFKQALVNLEDNVSTVSFDDIHTAFLDEMPKEPDHAGNWQLGDSILAEASVCAVVPGVFSEKETRGWPGRVLSLAGWKKADKPLVFKMVKPAIKANMASELALWGRLGDFLDENKHQWGLGDFQFKGTIDQVSWLLRNEIDLELEQQNLDAAADYYQEIPEAAIPETQASSTPDMTVMTRLDGRKITDVQHLSRRKRRALARAVAKLCILNPIIDLEEESLFHGDPHAGNIAYEFKGGKPKIIFYDWAMTGRLKRLERLAVMMMISGLVAGNETLIYYAADIMAGGTISKHKETAGAVRKIISRVLSERENRLSGVLGAVENLIEQLMYQGIVFSPDLLVFEKALVTLKGVLADVDPDFDRDAFIVFAAVRRLVADLASFRIQSLILKELWALYKHSLSVFMDIQRSLLRLAVDMAIVYGPGRILV
jgi:ubiquinone biosynthesis protein